MVLNNEFSYVEMNQNVKKSANNNVFKVQGYNTMQALEDKNIPY